jgi:hypothetical protein
VLHPNLVILSGASALPSRRGEPQILRRAEALLRMTTRN